MTPAARASWGYTTTSTCCPFCPTQPWRRISSTYSGRTRAFKRLVADILAESAFTPTCHQTFGAGLPMARTIALS
ncbi:hypothetical protein IscW_ISCW020534 [Ixodes scapularis]|uniref:Uncharacterized protein n=1 Tax=Ixodes scapularis TaxID=6945 RepID=B7Q1G9_IXOSC|nr:hypothetical protein IscW_ISCW020534 [Ixodes scapularis]|eukprot:XP_002409608.1 hypothetical protein IscW_ISCW020534 [Ixodes scapularis]